MSSTEQNPVVEELLGKPSAVSPTLFVGLGGCGCRMVRRIAQHLRRRPDFEERYKALVKIALVDTNVNDLESYREIADDTFLISDFEKEEYAALASGKMFLEPDPYFVQWVPQTYRFRAGDTAGAGQIRIESRLGVFYQMKHKSFVPRFRRLLEQLKDHEHGHRRLDSPEIRIVLCYSVAGGTGSGCHLPIAYMLRDQARELGKPFMIGVAVLPSVFEDMTGVNRDGTYANGYAALKETEHLMKLGAPDSQFFPTDGIAFHYDPSDSAKQKVGEKPFEFVYVIDKPESFTVSQPVDAAADGLYLQFFSPLFGNQASDYDNYTQHQRFLVPHDFEERSIQGYTSFYGSFGAAVLLVPVPGLVDYCSRAAALSLIRSSFLRSIPGDPAYTLLRNQPEPFHEVALDENRDTKPVHEAEFHKKERGEREVLIDRLFAKRVRLLASAELDAGESKRFLAIFRHGHLPGEVPQAGGGYGIDEARIPRDHEQVGDLGMRSSIGSVVLPALLGEGTDRTPGLLRAARGAMEQAARNEPPVIDDRMTVAELKNRASHWIDEYRRIGLRIVKNGYTERGVHRPGMDSLAELDFLKRQAGDVDLAAKRYAMLLLRERVDWQIEPPHPTGELDAGDRADSDRLRQDDAQALAESFQHQAIGRGMDGIWRLYVERLQELNQSLRSFVQIHRSLESGFDNLERDELKALEKLRTEGDDSTNQYILDAEALQIENGRRMWDFYHEDRIAGLPELGLGDKRVQQLLSDTVTELSLRNRLGTSGTLDKLYQSLRKHARAILQPVIGGDPHAVDPERRHGLVLPDALELEVVYRALYWSNTEQVEAEGGKAIRELIARYRHLPEERRLDLSDARHTDYLRDKVKRLVQEKASLLCVYDDSRDQHGGVRPDHVFLAAIDEGFAGTGSAVERAIRSADSGIKWVTTGWHDPKEIVVYRAVLNVPLYVFGRMAQMKSYYHQFRQLARRPKVLHIDKNWENDLPDLDPDAAREKHRQRLLRDQVINFSALLSIEQASDPSGPSDGSIAEGEASPQVYEEFRGPGLIVRREGRYLLVDPQWAERANGHRMTEISAAGTIGELEEPLGTPLGDCLATAIEQLPEVLEGEKVKYLPYQQMLRMVREGLAPRVILRIARLPFRWRRNHDQLRNQYGSSPDHEQRRKLADYRDSYQGLQQALYGLHARLKSRRIEHEALDEDLSVGTAGLDQRQAWKSLCQSLEILKAFVETWEAMENPEKAAAIPSHFRALFAPLEPEHLNHKLKVLHQRSAGA